MDLIKIGDEELGTTQQESQMSPEQRALFGQRQGMVAHYSLPLANQYRSSQGLPPLDPTQPGWDEGALFGAASGFAAPPGGSPFSLHPDTAPFRTGLMDYSMSSAGRLDTNPFRMTQGPGGEWGYNDPTLNMTHDFLSSEFDNLAAFRPEASFVPTATNYDSVVDRALAEEYGMMGGGGGVAAGQAEAPSTEAAIAAAKTLMERVTGPGLTAAMSSVGKGRSGAEAEAIANAGMAMALPISDRAMQEQGMTSRTNAQLTTSANIAAAQIDARKKEVAYLQAAQSKLQGQMLTARSESERQALSAELSKVNAQLSMSNQALRTDMAKYMGNLGLQTTQAGAGYDLASSPLITQLYQTGMNTAQLPNLMDQQELARQTANLFALMGLTPSPGGGTTTMTGTQPYTVGSELRNVMDLWSSFAGGMGGAMI